MEYCEIELTVPAEALEAVTDLLHRSGTGGVVIDDEHAARLRAYLPRDGRLEGRLGVLRQQLTDLVAFFPGMRQMTERRRFVADEEWADAWRAHFHPSRVGTRLVVVPTWENFQPAAGDIVLRLDPGMAFGTGTHASTALCLQALETQDLAAAHVLDVGTGSGILAVAAALFGAADVTAVDIDPLAVRIARQNAEQNGVADRVHARYCELRDALGSGLRPARLVLANLTADVLVEIAPDLAAATEPGGLVVASGILAPGRLRVEPAFAAVGLETVRATAREDWVALWARRP